MNVIVWISFFNLILTMLLVWAIIEVRRTLIVTEEQQIDSYKRVREIITECLKLKEVHKHE